MSLVKRFHLLHTNDLHSRLDQAAKIHELVTKLRGKWQKRGEGVILVDVGDHMDRMRMETEGTDGRVNRAILEKTGYDLFTFGNNELLTFTKSQLASLFGDAPFAVVSSNVFDHASESRPHWIAPYKVLTISGVRFGFLAATIPYPVVYEQMGWTVKNPFLVLKEVVPQLRDKADILILLSHLGLNNDRLLAEQIDGFDLILGAHTHHLLDEPEKVRNTWIAAAGKFGEYLGHISLDMDVEAGELKTVTGCCYPIRDQKAAPVIQRLIGHYRVQAVEKLSEPIACLKEPLRIDWNEESPFGNLLADSLREWVEADIALVNNGQLLDSLPKGDVTRELLHRTCPHPINPVLIRIKGEDIRRTLEESLLTEYKEMPIRGFGFRGKVLGGISVSGMEIRYDPSARPYQKIRHIMVGDKRLNDEEEYRLATIDMFTFGVGYLALKKGELLHYFLPEFLRDLLAEQLKKPEALKQCRKTRWIRE